MACTRSRSEVIAELAAGRLAVDAAGEFLEHVGDCPQCSAEFDLVADFVAGAEAAGQGFFAGTGLAATGGAGRLRPFPRFAAVAAAAAVLATVALWLVMARPVAPDVAELATIDPIAATPGVLRGESGRELLDSALEAYAAARWSDAASGFEQVLGAGEATGPAAALPSLYLGIARLQLNDAPAAVAALEVASEVGAGLLRERALWYLANAHLLAGDAPAATQVFGRLARMEGDYELNALEKLEQLR